MSISEYELANAVHNAKTLRLLEPLAKKPTPVRLLLLSNSMLKDLDGPWQSKADEYRLGGLLRTDLERFVSGDLMRATLGGPVLVAEDMKRLNGVYEIWEFKSDVERKIRVFGRFAGYDIFVATHWQWRDVLDNYGSPQWNAEIKKCQDIWFNIFQKHTPHTGATIDAYLSDAKDATLYY